MLRSTLVQVVGKKFKLTNLNEKLNEFFEKFPNSYILKFEPVLRDGSTVGFIIIHKEMASKSYPAEVNGKEPVCPSCSKKMVLRVNKSKGIPFWGCSQYPKCSVAFELSEKDKLEFWGPRGDPGPSCDPPDNNEDIPF